MTSFFGTVATARAHLACSYVVLVQDIIDIKSDDALMYHGIRKTKLRLHYPRKKEHF